MSANRKLMAFAILAASSGGAHAFDPLLAEQGLPATAGGSIARVCEFSAPPSRPLRLAEAVERTLCNNPRTRAAWASVKAQAAGVGAARAAYLPQISANWQGVRESLVQNLSIGELSLDPRMRALVVPLLRYIAPTIVVGVALLVARVRGAATVLARSSGRFDQRRGMIHERETEAHQLERLPGRLILYVRCDNSSGRHQGHER